MEGIRQSSPRLCDLVSALGDSYHDGTFQTDMLPTLVRLGGPKTEKKRNLEGKAKEVADEGTAWIRKVKGWRVPSRIRSRGHVSQVPAEGP